MSAKLIDTGYDASTGKLSSNTFVTRTAPEHVAFRAKLRGMLNGNAATKNVMRDEIVKRIQSSPTPSLYITLTLSLCSQSSGRGGLYDGIDILSQLGDLMIDYSTTYSISDVMQQGKLFAGTTYRPNDDYWYIIFRSVARCSAKEDSRYQFISACKCATSIGIREGVVEALGDLASKDAQRLLQDIASEDNNAFIRNLATETLKDIES